MGKYIYNRLARIIKSEINLFSRNKRRRQTISTEYGFDFLGSKNNIGIGKAFLELINNAKSDYILLLENDWELVENISNTTERKVLLLSASSISNQLYIVINYLNYR
jgi:hypothetical protein